MNEPVWIEKAAVLLVHAETLAEHGGLEGFRDEGLLESALDRARNTFFYGGIQDLPALAAAYAIGIARNHPFADGNKRTAFITAALFLALNGLRLVADQLSAIRTFVAVAAGELEESELASWFRNNTVSRNR